ncbi:MAG: hypothetical protein HDQ87_08625 [Clostridia bacterium]|nr:hypothetical protein [Clostridia bacterium]
MTTPCTDTIKKALDETQNSVNIAGVSQAGIPCVQLQDYTMVTARGNAILTVTSDVLESYVEATYGETFPASPYADASPWKEAAADYIAAFVENSLEFHTETMDFDPDSAEFICINPGMSFDEYNVSVEYELDLNGGFFQNR